MTYRECFSLSLGAAVGGACGMGAGRVIGGTLICRSVSPEVLHISKALRNSGKYCGLAWLRWSLRARIPCGFKSTAVALPLRGGEGDTAVLGTSDSRAISEGKFFLGSRSKNKQTIRIIEIIQLFFSLHYKKIRHYNYCFYSVQPYL